MSISTQEKDNHIQKLLESYLTGNLDENNVNILFDYIRDHRSESARLLLQSSLRNYHHKLQQENTIPTEQDQRMRERLLKEINSAPVVQMRKTDRRRSFAAAAVILCVTAATTWFFFKPAIIQLAKAPAAEEFKNDIAPGANRAVLTLADGKSILLDIAHTGTLASQGGTKVSKLADGQLIYDFQGNADKDAAGTGYNTITTPKGGQYQVRLPDGTNVWLNAASSLRFPTVFTGTGREVELNGEAYMEVAADKSRPFQVKVKNMNVTVLGTRFNIMGYDDENHIVTTLVDGSVQINDAINPAKLLKPGEHAVMGKAGSILVEKADVEQEIAWKNGLIQYSGANIQQIMRQVARWYNVEVVYEGNMANKDFACAVSRNANVSQLFKMLELTGAVHFTIEGQKVIVRP